MTRLLGIGLILDMDGVLIDSVPAHENAFCQTLESFGITQIDYAQLAGKSTPDVFLGILSHSLGLTGEKLQTEVRRATAMKRRIFRDQGRDQVQEAGGLKDFLDFIRNQKISYGIASSASAENVAFFGKKFGFLEGACFAFSEQDCAKAKPDPAIYHLAKSHLAKDNILPKNMIVLEDAESGVRAANAADLRVWALGQVLECRTVEAFVEKRFLMLSEVLEHLRCLA